MDVEEEDITVIDDEEGSNGREMLATPLVAQVADKSGLFGRIASNKDILVQT